MYPKYTLKKLKISKLSNSPHSTQTIELQTLMRHNAQVPSTRRNEHIFPKGSATAAISFTLNTIEKPINLKWHKYLQATPLHFLDQTAEYPSLISRLVSSGGANGLDSYRASTDVPRGMVHMPDNARFAEIFSKILL